MKTSILVYLLFLGIKFSHVYGYRDGARNDSCFDHTINHGPRLVLLDCVPTSSPPCRYFLIIKEVVNEGTLELGNQTEYYECGKIYGVEVANSLNPPEGFLVQARSGPEDSSEIIGTFLNPIVIEERDSSIPRNYKVLECRHHQNAGPELYPNSATHPDTVNQAERLQLFWKAPNCTGEILPNVTMWFTIVQQELIAFRPAKYITLTYRPPPPIPTFSSAVISSSLSASTNLQAMPTPTSAPTTKQMQQSPTTKQMQQSPTTKQMQQSPTTKQIQQSQTTTITTKQDILSQEQIIGLAGGGGAGLFVLIIIIVITVVIAIKLVGSSKKKKKQPSRMSVLWAAGNEPPLTPESNGKQIEFVTDSEPLTLKEHKEHDSKLVNGGNAEDNSTAA